MLATGAHERPLVFAGNDVPGVMLAGAVRTYLNRYAVKPGERVVLATTNDSAYDTAEDLLAAGVEVVAVLDAREELSVRAEAVAARGVRVVTGSTVQGTDGDRRPPGDRSRCSAPWTTATRPRPGRRCRATWSPSPAAGARSCTCTASARDGCAGTTRWPRSCPTARSVTSRSSARPPGVFDLDAVPAPGLRGRSRRLPRGPGSPSSRCRCAPAPVRTAYGEIRQLWLVPGVERRAGRWTEHFVDLQRDQTVADVWRATGAGMRSVEHVKRYTSIGTGQDQGKTSGVTRSA